MKKNGNIQLFLQLRRSGVHLHVSLIFSVTEKAEDNYPLAVTRQAVISQVAVWRVQRQVNDETRRAQEWSDALTTVWR